MSNKTKDIIIFCIFLFWMTISIIIIPLQAGDEFINYYNAYKIFNGEMIYIDVNIVSTPLLFYIAMIFFKILGTSLIVFRIYNIIINIFVAINIYNIFRKLKIEKIYSIIYTLILEIIIVKYVVIWGATYNILGLLLCLLGINIYLNREKTKYHNLKQGIMIFLIIMAKQNIGIYYSLAYIITELILKRKEGVKNLLKTFITTLFGCILYLIYLYFNGNLDEFINYAVLGISEFSTNILINAFDYIIIDILIILFVIFVIYKRKYKSNDFKNIIILFVFGSCLLLIGYPIVDRWHMVVASTVLIICMIYVFHNTVILELKIEKKKIEKLLTILVLFILLVTIYKLSNSFDKFCTDKTNKFYIIPIDNNTTEKINLMEQYFLENNTKVIVVSPEAGMYKINIGLNSDGIFDIPFIGNFGKEGEKALINKVQKYKDTYVLIHAKKTYWQESDMFREYVINNYKKIGDLSDFSIYYIHE